MIVRYLEAAMAQAAYKRLEDGTYAGRIPICPGVVAFGKSLRACKRNLRSALEDWVLLGLQWGDPLPVINGIDLNRKPIHEPLASV